MIPRIVSAAILIAVVVAAVFYLPLPIFLLFLDLLLVLGLRELFQLVLKKGVVPLPVAYVLLPMFPWVWSYSPQWVSSFAVAVILLLISWALAGTDDLKLLFSTVSGNLFAMLYLGIPFALAATYHPAAPQARGDPERPWELLLVLVLVWVSDAGAFFTGKLAGRHKVTPRISPNKSLEGFIAGLILPVPAAVLYSSYLLPGRALSFVFAAAVSVAAAGIAGDLFESALKRGSEVKDSSTLIPGHGGVLDRIDSLLLAFPAYHVISNLLA